MSSSHNPSNKLHFSPIYSIQNKTSMLKLQTRHSLEIFLQMDIFMIFWFNFLSACVVQNNIVAPFDIPTWNVISFKIHDQIIGYVQNAIIIIKTIPFHKTFVFPSVFLLVCMVTIIPSGVRNCCYVIFYFSFIIDTQTDTKYLPKITQRLIKSKINNNFFL